MRTTLAFLIVTLAAALVPGSSLELQRGGALWRIVTCHFTHFTYEQLAWDAFAFLLLGTLCARRNLAAFQATLLASIVIVPLAVLAFAPSITAYRGLSGIDCALFALLVATSRDRVAIACALLFAAKTMFEIATGSAVFAGSDAFVAVPVAHIAGACVGQALSLSSRLRRTS